MSDPVQRNAMNGYEIAKDFLRKFVSNLATFQPLHIIEVLVLQRRIIMTCFQEFSFTHPYLLPEKLKASGIFSMTVC